MTDLNPYASPAAIDAERIQRVRTELMWRLRGPSLGLLVLAGLQVLGACLALPQLIMHMSMGGMKPEPLLAILGCGTSSLFICFAAWRMRQMKSLRICRLGAILACIPFLAPVYVLGIPFGIWAAIVLYMPTTAAAFEQQEIVPAILGD